MLFLNNAMHSVEMNGKTEKKIKNPSFILFSNWSYISVSPRDAREKDLVVKH